MHTEERELLASILVIDLLDFKSLSLLKILLIVAVWRYSCFLVIQIHILISFKFGILCDDYPACESASIYKLLIGEFFFIYYDDQ